MSRRNLHNDENFWPCVSDMFLALFVIALVLYSSMSRDKGEGERYVSELAAQEACALFETLKREYPDSETLKSINVEDIRKEPHGARRKLSESLYSLLDCDETAKYFYGADENVLEERPNRYSSAIALLYKARFKDGTWPVKGDPCFHVHMREVREHVEREIYKAKSGSVYSKLTREELLAIIKKLEQQISNMVSKELYAALEKKYKDLLAVIDESDKLDRDIKKLKSDLADVEKNIDEQNKTIAWQKGIIVELQYTRIHVMEQVENLLNNKYRDLKDANVTVNKEDGIVIIPSSAFSFPKATAEYYQQGGGVRAKNLNRRLENHLTHQQIRNLKLLSEFLKEIGGMVNRRELAVDSISIECHTDDDVSNITDKKYYNDGLSLQRAFDVWRLLDKYQGGSLSKYENEDGQRLFSMTGFGMRVLPYPKEDEDKFSKPERENLSRRMQLRFNCKPKKGRLSPSTRSGGKYSEPYRR